MINGIRQKAIVGKGGRIEIRSPELPMVITVEIIVLIELPSPYLEKEYGLQSLTDGKPFESAQKEWPLDFFEKTAGCLADDPIERAP